MQNETVVSGDLKHNWGWLLGLGILFVIFGCIGLSMTAGLTVFSMFFLGVLMVIGGVSQIIDVFKSTHWKAVLWHALIAILYIFGGVVVIYDPLLASTMLTAMIAGMLIVIGITRFLMAITLRHQKGAGWLFFAGLIAILLGVEILAQWPWSGLWVIGLFIAVEMLVNGWTYIFIALGMRRR